MIIQVCVKKISRTSGGIYRQGKERIESPFPTRRRDSPSLRTEGKADSGREHYYCSAALDTLLTTRGRRLDLILDCPQLPACQATYLQYYFPFFFYYLLPPLPSLDIRFRLL